MTLSNERPVVMCRASALRAAALGVATVYAVFGTDVPPIDSVSAASSDTDFVADGPSSNSQNAGFWSRGETSSFTYGVVGSGTDVGVLGSLPGSGIPRFKAGLYGDGGDVGTGVVGIGTVGQSGVLGIGVTTGVIGQGSLFGVMGQGTIGVVGGDVPPGNYPSIDCGVFGHGGSKGDGVHGIAVRAGGTGISGIGTAFGVSGRSVSGKAVSGVSVDGTGVSGSSPHGRGGEFSGGVAQLRLRPDERIGPPITGDHKPGDIFLDRNSTLYICVKVGTPGRWARVETTLVN